MEETNKETHIKSTNVKTMEDFMSDIKKEREVRGDNTQLNFAENPDHLMHDSIDEKDNSRIIANVLHQTGNGGLDLDEYKLKLDRSSRFIEREK